MLILPAKRMNLPGFYDNFNRANQTLAADGNYLLDNGALSITSNRVEVTDPSTNQSGKYDLLSSIEGNSDGEMIADFIFDGTSSTSRGALNVRVLNSTNLIEAQLRASGALFLSLYSPGYTNLGNTTVTLNSTGTANQMRVVFSGTSIDVHINGAGTPDVSGTTSTHQNETGKGFYVQNASVASSTAQDTYLDNLEIIY